jgi:lambda family phage portal protein
MNDDGLNWLDRAVGWVSPSAGFKRARARYLTQVMQGAMNGYEAASKSRRFDKWKTRGTSANAEIRAGLPLLRDRSRALVRDNPYATKAIGVIAHNLVGGGIRPQIRVGDGNRVLESRFERVVRLWMNTTACDADGRLNFYGLQNLAARTIAESGEVLIRRRRRFSSDPLEIPLQLQVLEPDFLDTGKDGAAENGGVIVQGVQFDQIGRRTGYWVFSQHPGDATYRRAFESKFVPASEMLHVYRIDRPGQVRGVPWAAPIIVRLKDFADYEDAQLVRQKIAACYVAFVTQADPTESAASSDSEAPLEKFEPGVIDYLPPGKDVKFATPPSVDGLGEYARVSLIGVAAGFGIPYEALTGDLSNVNYSSGRMGWLEYHRANTSWQWNMFIPQFCDGVVPWIRQSMLIDANDVRFEWTPPRREMIDPGKETEATKAAIRAGTLTLSEAIRREGDDPEEHFAEYAADMERLDKLGITLDSDPRKTTTGGKLVTEAAPDRAPETAPQQAMVAPAVNVTVPVSADLTLSDHQVGVLAEGLRVPPAPEPVDQTAALKRIEESVRDLKESNQSALRKVADEVAKTGSTAIAAAAVPRSVTIRKNLDGSFAAVSQPQA